MNIGNEIRIRRKEKNMTLKELSQKSGVQVATLSRIENNIMTGTLESHVKICRALGVSLSDFYREVEEKQKTVSLVKADAKERLLLVYTPKSVTELLAPRSAVKNMLPLLIKLRKGGKTQKEENAVGSEKFIYVLKGKILARIGKGEYHLPKSYSMYFDATLPHMFCNEGDIEAHMLSVLTLPAS